MPRRRSARRGGRRRRASQLTRWLRRGALVLTVLIGAGLTAGTLLYWALARQIDDRLAAGWSPPPTRLFAVPLELARGMALDRAELAVWLDDLGYTERDRARGAGEFSLEDHAVTLIELTGATHGRTLRVRFGSDPGNTVRVQAIEIPPAGDTDRVVLAAPLLSTLHAGQRRKRRDTPLSEMPRRVIQAVVAAEDHRFFDHHGIDAIRIAGAAVTNMTGNRRYLVGASTLTQQLVKNTLLSPEQTISRKLREQALAMLLERRLPKARILELYLNDVYLGQQGSFAIHGVAQGARALFGKDLANLTLGEIATMAGIIQAPQLHAPSRHPERARTRRNGVLQAMVERRFLTPDEALEASREPMQAVGDTVDVEAPYFVDLVRARLGDALADREADTAGLTVQTTLDAHLQQQAEIAVREGLGRIARQRPESAGPPPQAALIAVEPRTGAIRALVGGGSYRQSQFNRADRARRQPGSIVKPFAYLAAFERARRDPTFDFTASSLIDDAPTTFVFGERSWQPANYGDVYDGPITARLALARSRNVAAVKVAEQAGFRGVADLWAAAAGSAPPPAYPSIALGVFEATPLEVATAYTVLANGGIRVPLTSVTAVSGNAGPIDVGSDAPRRVASADSAYLVTQMLQGAFDSGTAAAARQQGFLHEAAGKTGTTDDLRDAWFAGFTPDLLTVVWVGMDDGSPLGLSGAQAALPLWTDFMRHALDGRKSRGFTAPDNLTFVDVDPVTGLRATPRCPETIQGAFRDGTAPHEMCALH